MNTDLSWATFTCMPSGSESATDGRTLLASCDTSSGLAVADSLPDGMQVKVAHDKSVFIAESIKNVYRTIGEAILLVAFIIFLFLRSVRATLIPLVTIPVSYTHLTLPTIYSV